MIGHSPTRLEQADLRCTAVRARKANSARPSTPPRNRFDLKSASLDTLYRRANRLRILGPLFGYIPDTQQPSVLMFPVDSSKVTGKPRPTVLSQTDRLFIEPKYKIQGGRTDDGLPEPLSRCISEHLPQDAPSLDRENKRGQRRATKRRIGAHFVCKSGSALNKILTEQSRRVAGYSQRVQTALKQSRREKKGVYPGQKSGQLIDVIYGPQKKVTLTKPVHATGTVLEAVLTIAR
ncbi:hypothetical protein WN55_00281 [Dufourea novaeangliae]|uniref:Uncharacterized protein n=1 Tax=Dufourea novaeangliae TaxID=178035 RepID=A0A154PCF8_DUFNO|nr:hypothetical protein WN55_00281 [Dufourea novaeangliae]